MKINIIKHKAWHYSAFIYNTCLLFLQKIICFFRPLPLWHAVRNEAYKNYLLETKVLQSLCYTGACPQICIIHQFLHFFTIGSPVVAQDTTTMHGTNYLGPLPFLLSTRDGPQHWGLQVPYSFRAVRGLFNIPTEFFIYAKLM